MTNTPEQLSGAEREEMSWTELREHLVMHMAYKGSTPYAADVNWDICRLLGYDSQLLPALFAQHHGMAMRLRASW